MADLAAKPEDGALLDRMLASVGLAQSLPFVVELRGVQDRYYQMLKTAYPGVQNKAKGEDQATKEWVARFLSLGAKLSIRVT